ncbi:hypothetical protein [Lactobacillus sp. PV034]|uniref:hypothetical protein n=1 Tax=Lactobacillus sp. PV034 TaxID=2594495 RepID=UPI00223FDFB7|nr:hypothetical protein [Lactobacillus sp. PV034]QNQ80519.1 hypothetical protein FP432_02610 [Lactobacillus sp. PV034]
MKIKELSVNNKKFDFSNKTLVYSTKNSVGKTTLLRLILYALGYNVPSTKGLNFKNLSLNLKLSDKNHTILINRSNNELTTNLFKNKLYSMKIDEEQNEFHSSLFGIDIPEIVNNILGLIYFDQEKGWTLLNRGLVIGSIHFQIEELIEGLEKSNLIELKNKIDKLSKERKIYSQLEKLINLQTEYNGNEHLVEESTLKLQSRHKSLRLEIKQIKKEISDYVKIQKDNKKLIEFIEESGIRIKMEDKEVAVTKENIIGYNTNQRLIDAILTRKRSFLKEYEYQLYKIEEKLNQKLQLINIEDRLEELNGYISSNMFSEQEISILISKYTKELKKLNKLFRNQLYNSKVTRQIYKRIKKYSRILKIEDSIDESKDFIFTKNLKQYSGAKLHLLVFTFRMALLKEVQDYFKIELPIILDSPKTGELDENNLNLMFTLLKKEFPNNQLIVASIISKKERLNERLYNGFIKIEKSLLEN